MRNLAAFLFGFLISCVLAIATARADEARAVHVLDPSRPHAETVILVAPRDLTDRWNAALDSLHIARISSPGNEPISDQHDQPPGVRANGAPGGLQEGQ